MYKSQKLTFMIHSTIATSLNMLLLYIASTCVTSWMAPRESLHKSRVSSLFVKGAHFCGWACLSVCYCHHLMGFELRNVIVLLLACHINKEGCVHMRVNHRPKREGVRLTKGKRHIMK